MPPKNRDAKLKANRVYSSGGGGSSKGPSILDKRNEGHPCPHCERVFKQSGRLKEHIATKHSDAVAKDNNASENKSTCTQTVMDVGSRAGAYDRKSPKLLLQELCVKLKRPKPKYVHLGNNVCKVILPSPKPNDPPLVFFHRQNTAHDTNTPQGLQDMATQQGALVALHHFAGDRQLDLVLPDVFKQQWQALGEQAAKRRAAEQQKAQGAARKQPKTPNKQKTQVIMTEQHRTLVEGVLGQAQTLVGHGHVQLDAEQMIARLLSLGFAEKHAITAAGADGVDTLDAALEWLCLSIPEAELPAAFAPGAAGRPVAVLKSSSAQDLPADVKQLCAWGYPQQAAAHALSQANGNLIMALCSLYAQLTKQQVQVQDDASSNETWQEECTVLQAIHDQDLQLLSPSICQVSLSGVLLTMYCTVGYPVHAPLLLTVQATDGATVPASTARALTAAAARAAVEAIGDMQCHAAIEAIIEGDVTQDVILDPFSIPADDEEGFNRQKHNTTAQETHLQRRKESIAWTDDEIAAESLRLTGLARQHGNTPQGKRWAQQRAQLLAATMRAAVLQAVDNKQVTVICGATGCGKSTQVPQYLLENAIEQGCGGQCNVIVTQPRRISAIGLAMRVAQERTEQIGQTVGYSVRMESRSSRNTRLLYCTTGVLLRQLMHDQQLQGVSHVMVDEVHERSLDSDLLLLLLRDALLRQHARFKLVLMSATVDAELFAGYFGAMSPSVLHIQGRTFPVRDLYLEDALAAMMRDGHTLPPVGGGKHELDKAIVERHGHEVAQAMVGIDQTNPPFRLLVDLIAYIVKEQTVPHVEWPELAHPCGSVLVFLPGAEEIDRLVRMLADAPSLKSTVLPLPLHGGLPQAQQARVFDKTPLRKVIVATNVAETSITIDDCTVVVDWCRVKQLAYDPTRGITQLITTMVSKAAAQQRRGRAGRVQPGVCFRLVTNTAYNKLDQYTLPEICRVPLEGLCLQIKAVIGEDADVAAVLQNAITPPPTAAVDAALARLEAVGALDTGKCLTGLGAHLAALPMDAHIAKMLVYACLLHTVSPVLTIAAAMAYGRPMFSAPSDKRTEADAAKCALLGCFIDSRSDHIAMIAAYNGWRLCIAAEGRTEGNAFCGRYFLVESVLEGILASRREFAKQLQVRGLLPSTYNEAAVEQGAIAHWRARKDGAVPGSLLYTHEMDAYSANARVVKAAIAAGLYPNLLRVEAPPPRYQQIAGGNVEVPGDPSKIKLFNRTKGRVFVHPASVNFGAPKYESGWLVYSQLVETSKPYVRELSMVPAYAVLLFCGMLTVQLEAGTVKVDNWATFSAPASIAVLVQHLRHQLDGILKGSTVLAGVDQSTLNVYRSRHMSTLETILHFMYLDCTHKACNSVYNPAVEIH